MRAKRFSLVAVLPIALGVLAGCDDVMVKLDGGNVADASGPACPASTADCVNDHLARVCPADGSGWLSVPCASDQTCVSGSCTGGAARCAAGEGHCMDESTALRCKSDGSGFEVINCPAMTQCTGAGLCAGACIVGSSRCSSTRSIGVCANGIELTLSDCSAGEACVTTARTPIEKAACRPADCTPNDNGCGRICGNMNDSNADQTTATSECVETAVGYRWLVSTCTAGSSCNPSGGACASGMQAECQTECTPGATRCSMSGLGVEECQSDGTWSDTVACYVPGGPAYSCTTDPRSGRAVCADAICATYGFIGLCDTTGAHHACDDNGRIMAQGTLCSSGLCNIVPGQSGPNTAGACAAPCTEGKEECLSGYSWRKCVGGRWVSGENCSAPETCATFINASGEQRHVCGECTPGGMRCSDDTGSATAPSDYVQVCDETGHYAAPDACTVGRCIFTSCTTDCVPATSYCDGNPVGPGGGTSAVNVCPLNGIANPANSMPCTGDQRCRRGSDGHVYGCVDCVGTINESALVDTRCTDSSGDPSGAATHVQTCQGDHTWSSTLASCNSSCTAPDYQVPPVAQGNYCHSCGTGPCTDSYVRTNFGVDCINAGLGAPMSCATTTGATVSDCCSVYCSADPNPRPAVCN